MRVIQGIDVDELPADYSLEQFGRVLILDGDGPAYEVAATVKRLDTAIRRFQQRVLSEMFMADCGTAVVHFTAKGCDKHKRYQCKGIKPYQGGRSGKPKPALLEPLREAMSHRDSWLEQFSCVLHHGLEADDGMMQDAYSYKLNACIRSDDKDLRMTPYLYFEKSLGKVMQPQPEGTLWIKNTDSGTAKLLGQGPMFFWAQMLMGDQADSVQGLLRLNGKLCGPVAAYNHLKDCKTQSEAANAVLSAYREIDQNPLPEAWMLWLTRRPGDTVLKYFQELDLAPVNKEYLLKCYERDWFAHDAELSTEPAPAAEADIGDGSGCPW